MELPIAKSSPVSRTETLLNLALQTLDEHKATDITSINLHGKSSFADYMVVASGTSQRHVGSLARNVAEKLKEKGFEVLSIEGEESCDWVLIDAGDVIVHVFKPETRSFYNLEKMWTVAAPALVAGA